MGSQDSATNMEDRIIDKLTEDHLLSKRLAEEYDKVGEALLATSPTVLILGPTGVGKSSIINAIFGYGVATVSDGKPCTQHFEYYAAQWNRTVHLYDSKGLEPLDSEFLKDLKSFISKKTAEMKNDPSKGIHCVWYVQSASGARWSDGDTRIVRDILGHIPTIVVLNKCDLATENQKQKVYAAVINANMKSVRGVVHISANPPFNAPSCKTHGDDDLSVNKKKGTWKCNECNKGGDLDASPVGIDELVQLTVLQLPELVRASFLAAQGARLKSKQMQAYAVVAGASLSAYAVGWSPIPMSDAPILVGIQITMAGALAAIFNILRSGIIPVVTGQCAAVGIGLGLASILKFIPGVGSIAGGIINSTVALIFTSSIGLFYTAVFSIVYRKAGTATAEQRTDLLLQILQKFDVKNIFEKIRALIKKIPYIPTSKAELEKLMPDIGAQVEEMVEKDMKQAKVI